MKKFLSKQGYVVYKVRREQLAYIGGFGICDDCGSSPDFGYLVPILNHYQCPNCFEEWNNNHTYYPEDLWFEKKYVKIYEDYIGTTNSFLSYVKKYSKSDFIIKSLLEAANTRGGDLDDRLSSHFINFLGETVKHLPLPKDQRKEVSSECKRLLKEYKEFYLD